MKLAILSDTHGLLRPEVTEHLKTADAILHGGDINRQSIVDELRQYAPLYIVRGNNDKDWAEAIPHDLTVTLGGVTFFMVHNRKINYEVSTLKMNGCGKTADGSKRVYSLEPQCWLSRGIYVAEQYGCLDFSIAKISRTSFLAA